MQTLEPQPWSGIICQPFVFGGDRMEWSCADEQEGKPYILTRERQFATLPLARIACIYDRSFGILSKPDWFSTISCVGWRFAMPTRRFLTCGRKVSIDSQY